jgi:sterol desaturase/sphingolipid hydroxylase (fatty acid hydroxylase superfamily)
MNFTYDWQASLAALLLTIVIVAIGQRLAFMIPAFKKTLAENREANKPKLKNERFRPVIIKNRNMGLLYNVLFLSLLMPFFTTIKTEPVLTTLWHSFAILMVYDFFYYLTHRFLFHGNGYLRRVHAVHHQARRPTSIDAQLVHPIETFIGIGLYYLTIAGVSLALGQTFSTATIVLTLVIYTQLNLFNHVHVQLNRFPYKTLNWIANMHANHHIDMYRGNYATITLLFDWLGRTFDNGGESPIKRPQAKGS